MLWLQKHSIELSQPWAAHLFNCRIWDTEAGEFVATLVHVESSGIARVTLSVNKPGQLNYWCV